MATSASKLTFLIAVLLICSVAMTTDAKMLKRSRIQFYLHEILTGPNPTAVPVAARSNYTGSAPYESIFGTTYVMDNPLRSTGDPNSSILGYAQGMYVMGSKTEVALFMSATYSFSAGKYNGSSFSLLARNQALNPVRELPIVGGTGKFRFGRGYCLVRTHSIVGSNNVIGYNATLYHF